MKSLKNFSLIFFSVLMLLLFCGSTFAQTAWADSGTVSNKDNYKVSTFSGTINGTGDLTTNPFGMVNAKSNIYYLTLYATQTNDSAAVIVETYKSWLTDKWDSTATFSDTVLITSKQYTFIDTVTNNPDAVKWKLKGVTGNGYNTSITGKVKVKRE